MINLRVATASTVTFVALLLVWSKLAEKGYDKAMPIVEEQRQQAQEQQRELSRLTRENITGLGAASADQTEQVKHPADNGFPDTGMPPRQLCPSGAWTGICENDGKSLTFMKFGGDNYWLWIKNPAGKDIREKGKYEYLFDSILFKPEGKSSYHLDYYMVSKNGIRLSGYNCYYDLEREENIKFDF